VNRNDTPEVVNRYVRDNRFTFRIVLGGRGPNYTLGKAYGVHAYPTNYLVSPDGKIAWRAVPFREIDPTAYTELATAIDKVVPKQGQ